MNDKSTGKEIITRLSIVYLAIVLFACAIIGRIIYLQIFEHDKWAKANVITQKDITIEPERGNIYACDGRILATSVPTYEVRMDLKCPEITKNIFNKNIDSLAFCLAHLFNDYTEHEYRRKLTTARNRGERYYLLQRNVDYTQLKKLKTFPILRNGQYKGGLIVVQQNKRIQPFNMANRTIGYLGKGGARVGIEGAYDNELSGEKGVRLVQKVAGNFWMPVSDENEVEPRNGRDVITTIDITVQDVAQNALKKQLLKHNASHGTAILMEVKTGDIKAIVNLKRDINGMYTEQYNYAIGERTEPGSTFKLPVLMAAIEDNFIDIDDIVDTEKGWVRYFDHIVRDSKEDGYGKISVQQVFEVSSNVGVSKIITQYYTQKPEQFISRLEKMGLMQPLNIDIAGEQKPNIKYPSDPLWSGISLPQMAYGYEVEQTPLQILTFYNAVANNGKMLKPRFVKEIREYGQILHKIQPQVINPSICSKATIDKAKKMLEGVVENGTAQNLKNSNYKIAGKTGTAQIANSKYGYKYQNVKSYQASFVGYFPAQKPKYTCIVVVNAPSNGVYYGNLVAGSVFKEIADKVYSTNIDIQVNDLQPAADIDDNVPYTKNGYKIELCNVLNEFAINYNDASVTSEWVATTKTSSNIKLNNRHITDKLVPDVRGMGAKDALFLLENIGLDVIIEGRGSVTDQSIFPGSAFSKGDRIVLKLT